jgi:uncharacterized coiled-coil protein SlyX
MSTQDYSIEVQRDIKTSVNYTDLPRSVHYIISANGNVTKIVNADDTAWGVNENSPSNLAQNLISGMPTNPDASLIHIAFEKFGITSQSVKMAARIICCLSQDYGISPSSSTILNISEFSPIQDVLSAVPTELIPLSQDCSEIYNPGLECVPDPVAKACCEKNTEDIKDLANRVSALEISQAKQNQDIASLSDKLDTLMACCSQVSSLQAQIDGLMSLVLKLKECTDCVCPADIPAQSVHYQCANEQIGTAGESRTVNFCTKLADTSPPSVLSGALWSDCISTAGIHQINPIVRLANRKWCAGKIVTMDLVICGNRYNLVTYDTKNGNEAVTLMPASPFIINLDDSQLPCCAHVEIFTNDATNAMFVIEYADYSRT